MSVKDRTKDTMAKEISDLELKRRIEAELQPNKEENDGGRSKGRGRRKGVGSGS